MIFIYFKKVFTADLVTSSTHKIKRPIKGEIHFLCVSNTKMA